MSDITKTGAAAANPAAEPDFNITLGCGTCSEKPSDEACGQHLAAAAQIVINGFIAAGKLFDRSNEKHVHAVDVILATQMKSSEGISVVYEVPKEPERRERFYGQIDEGVKQALNAIAPKC